jgi:hypothetical protein
MIGVLPILAYKYSNLHYWLFSEIEPASRETKGYI